MDEIEEFKKKLESLKEKLLNNESIDEELEETFKTSHDGKITLLVKRLCNDAILPSYNYEGDSGFDLYSTIDLVIPPLERAIIPTGLAFNIPPNTEIQIRSKSGISSKEGVFVLNSPGTIDQSYNGEIKVILFNTSQNAFLVKKGNKIAQAVVAPVFCGSSTVFTEVNTIKETERGDKGFGSTGK